VEQIPDPNDRQKKIMDYLKKGILKGKHFFKSKSIARDLGLSPNEVGTNIGMLMDKCDDIIIERWSYSHGTTWRVDSKAKNKST
jgi:hypothetical protein